MTLGIEQPLPCQQLLGMRVSLPVVVQESSHGVLSQDVVADLLLHEPEMFRDILLIFPETNCIFLKFIISFLAIITEIMLQHTAFW